MVAQQIECESAREKKQTLAFRACRSAWYSGLSLPRPRHPSGYPATAMQNELPNSWRTNLTSSAAVSNADGKCEDAEASPRRHMMFRTLCLRASSSVALSSSRVHSTQVTCTVYKHLLVRRRLSQKKDCVCLRTWSITSKLQYFKTSAQIFSARTRFLGAVVMSM